MRCGSALRCSELSCLVESSAACRSFCAALVRLIASKTLPISSPSCRDRREAVAICRSRAPSNSAASSGIVALIPDDSVACSGVPQLGATSGWKKFALALRFLRPAACPDPSDGSMSNVSATSSIIARPIVVSPAA